MKVGSERQVASSPRRPKDGVVEIGYTTIGILSAGTQIWPCYREVYSHKNPDRLAHMFFMDFREFAGFCADSTALLPFGVAKVLYCLRMHAIFCRQYGTFATRGSKSAVLSAETFLQSADSTALLQPGVANVLHCLQKIASMRRQYSTFVRFPQKIPPKYKGFYESKFPYNRARFGRSPRTKTLFKLP